MSDFDNDLFDDGMVVNAGDVILQPDGTRLVGASYEDGDDGLNYLPATRPQDEPGYLPITPPEEYDRINARVAPDGSDLTPNQIAKPHLWRAGDKRTDHHTPKKANRINVREMVNKLAGDTMLSPIEVMFYIMNANEESRHHLGLKKSDRISPNLRAKMASELMNYMASKLKSVEIKVGDESPKGTGTVIFLPKNDREQGAIAEQPQLVLPEKDGVTIPFSPELAAQLISASDDDDEDLPSWADGEE